MHPYKVSIEVINIAMACASGILLMVAVIVLESCCTTVIKDSLREILGSNSIRVIGWIIRRNENGFLIWCLILCRDNNSMIYPCVIPLTHQFCYVESARCNGNCITGLYLLYTAVIQYIRLICRLSVPCG